MSDTHTTAVAVIEHADDTRLHPLVRAMQASGTTDPATLRELLAIQREWEAGEAKRAYTRALVELKRDMPTVLARDQRVKFPTSKGVTSYTHTSLAAVMTAVTEPLTQHGFSIGWEPSTEGGKVTVTCRLTHAEGHSETCTIAAPVDTSGSKSPAQGVASTITLLQRYTAVALLGLATADMPEPHGAADPAAVDSARNLRFVAELRERGKSVADAVEFLGGGSVQTWTAAELDRLNCWIESGTTPAAESRPDPEEAETVSKLHPKLRKAAETLGYEVWQVDAVIEEAGSIDAALEKLRAIFRAQKK